MASIAVVIDSLRVQSHQLYNIFFVRVIWFNITKTCLYSFDPLKPHFYIVKLGLQGYILFFLFLLKNIGCGYSLEPPRRGGSNEYPQYMFWAEMWKISEFLSENFQFLVVKFSIYLNRRVFVMNRINSGPAEPGYALSLQTVQIQISQLIWTCPVCH